MSNVMELSLRGTSSLEKLMRAVLLDSENKVPAERLRIVGALAEGAIIESGSNSNGNWVRFADGTQVCFGRQYIPTGPLIHLVECGLWVKDITLYFPAEFTQEPACAATAGFIAGYYCWANVVRITNSGASIYTFYTGDAGTADRESRFIAVGKWK